jgi:hypothetical protein
VVLEAHFHKRVWLVVVGWPVLGEGRARRERPRHQRASREWVSQRVKVASSPHEMQW